MDANLMTVVLAGLLALISGGFGGGLLHGYLIAETPAPDRNSIIKRAVGGLCAGLVFGILPIYVILLIFDYNPLMLFALGSAMGGAVYSGYLGIDAFKTWVQKRVADFAPKP